MRLHTDELAQIAEQLKIQGTDFQAVTESLQALGRNARLSVPPEVLVEFDSVFEDLAPAHVAAPVLLPLGLRA